MSKDSATVSDDANFLLSGLAWQEGLLQSYRNYLLFTQSILLAVSAGLLTAQATSADLAGKSIFLIPAAVVLILAVSTLSILGRAVEDRAKAVDWWQRRLLRFERAENDAKHFATFRLAKEHSFPAVEIEAKVLDESQIQSLMRVEKPKARTAFGVFVPGFGVLWCVLGICAATDFVLALP